MVSTKSINFASGDNVLEGIAHLPEESETEGVVVLCHPHPRYGGNMDNHVTLTLAATLAQHGLAALRFNFRGVGKSGGEHTGGSGEPQDVLAAVEAARGLAETPEPKLALAGYSFGAVMAALAAPDLPGLRALALVSPAVASLPAERLGESGPPTLIVAGEQDPIAPQNSLQKLAAGMGERCKLIIMPATDHFWGQGFEMAAARITAWLLKTLRQGAG
ncbi:MAG TPA: alpha/beta fold hydrolase [Dehalococcoidia bacterium]|nr:alpha/beta fold hydrolase [Dehalococcoidia bacterium]